MKNNQIQDERILLERRKIQSTAYNWVVCILLISILLQQFFMRAPFAQFAVELFILIGCGLYNIICNYRKGIDIWNSEDKGKKILLNTIFSGIASTILLALLSGEYDAKYLLTYFVIIVVSFFTIRLIIIGVNKKKQQNIDKQLNDEDF